MGEGPRPEWADACCSVCPAQTLGPGAFDVVARPYTGQAFVNGMRVDGATGVPVCCHPFRLGAPPAPYASAGHPFPAPPARPAAGGREPIRGMGWPGVTYDVFVPTAEQLILPEDPQDLEAWMLALLRTAPDMALPSALEQAEGRARDSGRFAADEIVAALRRVLTGGLTR